MRHEEALGLQWTSVNLERSVITIEWYREKASWERVVPLSDVACATLEALPRYPQSDISPFPL